jgi:hypothetical protein
MAGLTWGSWDRAGTVRRRVAEARVRQKPVKIMRGDAFFIETSNIRMPPYSTKKRGEISGK